MNILFMVAVLLVAAVVLLAVVPVATAHDITPCTIAGCKLAASKHCGDGVDVCMTHEHSCAGCLRTRQENYNASAAYRDALSLYHASYPWDAFVYYGAAAAMVVCGVVLSVVAFRTLPDAGPAYAVFCIIATGGCLWTFGVHPVLKYVIVVPPYGPISHACTA